MGTITSRIILYLQLSQHAFDDEEPIYPVSAYLVPYWKRVALTRAACSGRRDQREQEGKCCDHRKHFLADSEENTKFWRQHAAPKPRRPRRCTKACDLVGCNGKRMPFFILCNFLQFRALCDWNRTGHQPAIADVHLSHSTYITQGTRTRSSQVVSIQKI